MAKEKIHNLNLKTYVEKEFGVPIKDLMRELYIEKELEAPQIMRIIQEKLEKYDYFFDREATIKDWIKKSGINYVSHRRRYKLYDSNKTILLGGKIHEVIEKLLLEKTGKNTKDTLIELHYDRQLNTNEITNEINKLVGVGVLNTSGENQEVRRLLKRYKIKKRDFHPKEHDKEKFSAGGTIGMSKAWENPDFIKRHKKRSSELMRNKNIEDWSTKKEELKKKNF